MENKCIKDKIKYIMATVQSLIGVLCVTCQWPEQGSITHVVNEPDQKGSD